MRMEAVTFKPETTSGNVWSILTTIGTALLTIATTLVAVTLAYGRLDAADKMHDRRLDVLEAQLARASTDNKTDTVESAKRQGDIERRLSTMEGDIRVIRQILEPPVRPR
jgi:hypothetical protein